VGLGSSRDASAIITRHDVDDSEYVVDDGDYPALVDLFEPGDCLGTLIHESYLLTVAHCAEDMRASQTLQVGDHSVGITDIIEHPDYNGWKYDIALIQLDEPVTDVTPYPLYRDTDEEGQTLILLGRGVHGTGIEGEPGATDDAKLRRATNVVTWATAQWIEVNFEEPGGDGITDMEGVGASGDSGGPAFIETEDGLAIAGLNSWGDSTPPIEIGQYGAQDYSTRVSQYLDWIDSEAGTSADGSSGTGGGDESTDDGKTAAGCGCTSSPAPVGWLALCVLPLVLLRRGAQTPHR
jgi:hypothetical protein